MQLLPLDVSCTNKDNVMTEQSSVMTANNNLRVIIPRHNPFFTKGFELRHPNSHEPLVLGKDYRFIYKYVDIEEVATDVLHGGIQIINPKLDGSFTYKYHPIGGQYCLPTMVLIDCLVNTLVDPVEVRWQNIIDRITRYAAEEHTQDWHDFRNSEAIARSIDGVAEALVNKSDAMDNAFKELESQLLSAKKRLDDSKFNEHVANHQSPHRLTPTQADGLDRNAVVQNALKVYGKTVLELAKYISDNELNQSHLDTLLPKLGGTLTKRLIMSSDGLLIRNSTGTSKLSLKDNALTLELENSLLMRADNDASSHDESLALQAGENQLVIKSDESGIQVSSLTYNGSPVLTDKTVRDHTGSIDVGNAITVTTSDSETLDFVGTGRKNDPLKINLKLKEASKHTFGITQISTVLDNTDTKPIAAKHAAPAARRIHNALEHTVKVNNKAFIRGDVTITEAELGIDRLDNTAPANKPVSNAQLEALRDKADVGHKHSNLQSTLIVDADDSNDGMVRLSNEYIKDVSASRGKGWAVTPASLRYLKEDIADTLAKSKRLVPVLDITVYGTMDYLPIPASGAYAAAGISSDYCLAFCYEDNGRWAFIRPGEDSFEKALVYYYFDVYNDKIVNLQSSSTKYIVDFIEPGSTLTRVRCSGDGAMIAMSDKNDYYLVLFNGTLNADKHVGCKILPNKIQFGFEIYTYVIGDWVYLISSSLYNGSWSLNMERVRVSDVVPGRTLTPETVRLKGTNVYGEAVAETDTFYLSASNISTDENANCLMLVKDNGKWATKNMVHSNSNYAIGVSDDGTKIRFLHAPQTYFANSNSNMWPGQWMVSYVVDLRTGTVTPDTIPEDFPMVLRENNLEKMPKYCANWPGSAGNGTGQVRYSKGKSCCVKYYGVDNLPYLRLFRETSQPTLFDGLHYKHRSYNYYAIANFTGRYGSPVHNNPRMLSHISGNRIIGWCTDNSVFIAEYDKNTKYPEQTTGYGPSTNRKAISGGTFDLIKLIPTIHSSNGNAVNDGYVMQLSNPRRTHTEYVGEDFSGRDVNISKAVADATINKLKSRCAADAIFDMSTYIKHLGTLYRFGKSDHLIEVCYDRYHSTTSQDETSTLIVYRAAVSYDSNNNITNVEIGEQLGIILSLFGNTVDISRPGRSGANWKASLPDGRTAYSMAYTAYNSYVGNGGNFNTLLLFNADGSFSEYTQRMSHTYRPYGWDYYHEIGIGYYAIAGQGESVNFYEYGGEAKSGFVLATAMPTGWVLYFTAEIPLMVNGQIYQMPERNFDVYQLFGERVKNKLIRIYIKTDDATPTYHLSLDDLSNDARYVYIGFCRTNNDRLYEIKITGVTIMSEFVELTDHILTPRAHGLTDLLQSIGKDKIVNADMVVSESDVVAGVPQYATKDYIYNLIKESDIGSTGKFQAVKELRHNFTAVPSRAPIPFPEGWNPSNTMVIIDDVRIETGRQGNYNDSDLFANGCMRDWSIHIKEQGGKYYLVGERFYHTTNEQFFPTSGHNYSTRLLLVRKK